MNKNETILAVMDAFEEADRLRIENMMLKERMERMAAQDGAMTAKERNIYEYGRRVLFETYGNPYYGRTIRMVQGDGGEDVPEAFGAWLERAYTDFPDFMSRQDFEAEYGAELRRKYERLLSEAGGE